MLSSVYLVEYTLHQNLMIEIYTRNFDLHITVPSPNLAFLCRNLDYKPYSINLQSILGLGCLLWRWFSTVDHGTGLSVMVVVFHSRSWDWAVCYGGGFLPSILGMSCLLWRWFSTVDLGTGLSVMAWFSTVDLGTGLSVMVVVFYSRSWDWAVCYGGGSLQSICS